MSIVNIGLAVKLRQKQPKQKMVNADKPKPPEIRPASIHFKVWRHFGFNIIPGKKNGATHEQFVH